MGLDKIRCMLTVTRFHCQCPHTSVKLMMILTHTVQQRYRNFEFLYTHWSGTEWIRLKTHGYKEQWSKLINLTVGCNIVTIPVKIIGSFNWHNTGNQTNHIHSRNAHFSPYHHLSKLWHHATCLVPAEPICVALVRYCCQCLWRRGGSNRERKKSIVQKRWYQGCCDEKDQHALRWQNLISQLLFWKVVLFNSVKLVGSRAWGCSG